MQSLLKGQYNEEVYLVYWENFRIDHKLLELREHYDFIQDLLIDVYNHCISPHLIKLDWLPNFDKIYNKKANKNKIVWRIKRPFSVNYSTVIAFIIMIASFGLANYVYNKGAFEYDLCMSVFTGVLVALIINGINSSSNKRVNKIIKDLNAINYWFSKMEQSYIKINSEMEGPLKDIENFVIQFLYFENSIFNFLENTEEIKSIKSTKNYHKLYVFQKEILEYGMSTKKWT